MTPCKPNVLGHTSLVDLAESMLSSSFLFLFLYDFHFES